MKKTTNYEQFRMITSNREIDERHVTRLCDSISENNLLEMNPIIVNEQMEVIDGQHRLEAAKRLKLPIYYVTGNVTKEDISTLNSVAKKWSLMDYVSFYTIENKPGFNLLSKFLAKYPQINITNALKLLTPDHRGLTHDLRNGTVDVINYTQACKIVDAANVLFNTYDFANDRSFISALRICFENPSFEFDHLRNQLAKGLSRRFVRCFRTREYLEMIQELYNFQIHGKNHIKLI